MAMGNRGSIVIDVQAQITGYNESIERMKKALDEIDLGSSIGKKLSKGIAAAEKELFNLGKEGMKRISSQGELDRLNDKLLKVGNLISELGAGFQQVSWKDLTSGAAQELRDLEKQVNDVRQATQNIVGDGFSKLITDAPELKKIFDELKIDPNKMGLNTIQEKFTQTLEGLDSQIKDFQQKLDRSKNKVNEYQTAVNTRDKILASDLGTYAVGKSRSDSYKLFQTDSGQKNIFKKKPEQINAFSVLSKEYIDEVKNLGNTILTNLGLDPARQKNPELLAQLRPQIEAKIQQLLEAQSAEAIKGILDDIDNSLKLQKGGGFTVQGKRLKGLAEITGEGSAASIITERLTSLMTTSKINPNALNDTKAFYNNALEQLRINGNYDTGDLQKLLDNILPSMSEEEIKTRFSIIAKGIVDGARQVKEAGEKAEHELNKENGINADVLNYNNLLGEFQAKRDQVAQAQQKVNPLINELRNTISNQEARIKSLEEQIRQLTEANTGKENPFQALGAETIKNTADQIEAANLAAAQYQHKLEQIQSLQQGLNNLQSFAQRWFSVYGAMRLVSNTFRSIKTNIKELDDIMTEIAIVTDMSQADLWQQMPQYISLAKEYAASLKGVYEVSQLYYQQGLQQADVMAMTEETLKMARISGLSYSQATDYMTNAVRSFRMEMTESQRVVDVYSALAASSATSTTELATAMSKTASSAQAVGSSFENTTAMMAVMIEATREAPENIGTAMKSIISRYGEMTTNPAKLVDAEGEEMSLNKVDKALQTVGISIHDAQGQFRDFDDVIMELAASWDTIDKNTQRYIATVMAGNRQQSRFLALVSNYERLVELSDEAANSEDAATLQVMKTMDSVSAKAQQLQTSLQSMYTQTGLEEFYKGVLDFTNGIIATFTQMPTIFKLPIPAILAFGQMFINVGTSLASVIKMLRDKLSVASAATEKDMHTAQEIAGKQRITTEEKVWLQRVQAAKKGAEQINGIERGIADTTNQVANQRMGVAQPTVAVTPTIDFSKFKNPKASETYYNWLTSGNAAQQKFADNWFKNNKSMQEQLKAQGKQYVSGQGFVEIGNAAEDASKKTQGLWASLQQNKAASIGLRMVGSSISLIAAGMGEATDGARHFKAALQGLGGVLQTISYLALNNPIMAIFTGVMTAVQVLSTWIETDAERLERLNKKADDTNNAYLQKRQDYKNFDTEVKKLKELEKARYDSEEANKEYIESSNRLAEQHPELITAFDSEGNAVLDLASTYSTLEEARKAAIESGKEANLASIERQQEILDQAQERKDNINVDAYSAFRDVNDIDEYSFQKAFRDRIKFYLRDQLGAIGGEGDTFEYKSQEQLEKVNNLINDWYNGVVTTANDWLKTGLVISEEEAQGLLDNFNQRRGLSNFDNTTVQAVKNLFGGTEDYLDEIIEAVLTDKVDEAKELIKNNKENLQETSKTFNSKLFDAFLTDLQEYSGIILDADNDVEKARQALKMSERAGIAREAELMMYGDQADFEKNTKYFKEFDEINGLISGYMYQQYQQYKDNLQKQLDNGENDITQDNIDNAYIDWVKDFSQDTYDNINGWIIDLWNKLSITNKQAFNEILKNNGKYTQDEFRTNLASFGANEELITALIDQYYNNNDYSNFISAIVERQKEQKGYQLTTKNYAEAIRSLGGEELQTVLDVYDTIAAQIDNKQITPQMGQDILDNYLKIWDVTKDLGGETKDIAQGLINEADFSSLAGFNEFQQAVKDSLLGEQAQNDLINAAHDLVMNRPINLETEFQTFSQKISSNMEDFEKAISNASKGMDFKDATELAQKLGKDITAFDFEDGKYFFDDFNAIVDAYFGEYDNYIADLEAASADDLSRLMSFNKITNGQIENANWSEISDKTREWLMGQGINVDRLQSVYKQFIEDQDKTTDNFLSYYADYLTNQLHIATDKALEYIKDASAREAINMGSISGFARSILGEEADPTALENTIKEAISSGNFDQVDPQYRQEWMEKYKDLNSSIYQALTEGFSDESIIEADDLDEAKQAALEPLVEKGWIEQYGEGMYKVVANIADFYDEIVTEINNGPGSNKDKREMTAALHNAKYEDNIYSALEDVVSNFDNFSYEAGQSLAAALGTNVETLLSQGILSQNTQGNLVASYQDTLLWLGQNIGNMSNKEYNDLRAKLEATNNKQRNENIFADIIKNRDSLNEQQVADLATMLGGYYSTVSHMLQDNGDGTKSISLQNIQAIINSGIVQITDEIQQLIANEIDSIIASLNGLGDIQSKGTTKIADMQKQVAEINKLSGQNYTMQDLFTYSDTLHGFVYSSQGLVESARQMKEQLETLSGDERWAAEQMLENTRNTFLQNIDVSSILNAERITPEIEDNFKRAISNFNKYMSAMGNASRIYGGVVFEALTKGGIEAVNAAQQIMAAQGKELSASDVEAAYRREVSSLVDAIDTVTSGAGALVDETTANLINAAGGKATELAGTGQYVVESAANLYNAYNELLNRLKDTGEATLADINKVAALALENKDGEQQAIDALGDAAGMTYTRFGEILAQAGYELSEELMSQLTSAGIVKQLGGSKMQIADFSAFADLMKWDAGSEEYVSAFKSYNDSLIEMNRKAEKNILEEAKNLENAKAGDQFNLTQLSAELNKIFIENIKKNQQGQKISGVYNPLLALSTQLERYGAELQDGILTIGEGANLPAIIQEISNAAQQYGGLLSSEMAELADVLANVLKNYAELIQNGIKGTLTNVQADELKGLGKQLGVEVDFTKTKEGLKATQQSAIQLYNELKKIDALQGQLTLETLADSLEASNENYANVSTITAHIAELQREIANLKPGDARLQMYREELATAEDILRVRSSTDSGSFDFMNRDLPNGMQNPIDYWNSTGEAYKAMNQAAKSGYMEIQDFYNIVNEMNNMAAASGQTLSFMGQTLSGKAEDAAALIEAGMGALKNVDGEGVKIALGSLGADFATGAANMTGDFDTGIKEMAKSQIKMLDAAIRMLEAIVAMENIDVNGDSVFDLGEIFANGVDSSGGFTQPVMDWLRQIDIATGGIQIGAQSLQQALLELGKVNPDSVVAIMNQLKNIDWTLGDVNTFAQIQNVLSTFFPGIQISQLGPSVFDLLDIPSDANEKTVQFQDFIEKTGLGVKEAQGVIHAIQNGILKPMSGKYGEHLGAKKGSDVYSAIESMLGLDKKSKKTFESFAGDYLTEDELQMWSKINIDYKKNGSIGSAIYTASDGSTHILDPKNVAGWQSDIEKIEDTIFKQQQTGRQDVANVEDSEPVTLESGFTVKGLIEAKDGGVDAWYKGTYLGNFPDKAAANAAVEAEALKRDKEARGIGNKTVITPEGTIETRADFTRKAKLSAEETQENKDFEKAVGQVYKEDADKINSLFQKGGQWEDYLKTSENGERTLELPGFESIKLADDQNPADLIKQLGEDLFSSTDQFAEIPQKIAEGIQQAFGGEGGAAIGQALMQGITDSLTTLTEITPGQLPEVATALSQVATQGERLKAIPWDTIVSGIRAITNAQNGGNGGDNGNGGINKNPDGSHWRDPGITGHDRPTQYGNTNQPIKLEGVKADKVDAAGATIEASGASINTGNTGGKEGEENNDSNISSITTSGAINVSGSPVNITGASSGGNDNGGGGQDSTNLNPSGVTDAIKTMQSAINGMSAAKAEEAASAFNKAMSKTMDSVPNSKTVNVKVNTPTDSITLKAKIDVEINDVTGPGTVKGTSIDPKGPGKYNPRINYDVRAKGNVALAKGRETLMGELGPELVVSGGRYYTVGNNGAEFVDLPDDAIVFNHKQTRRLLGSKKATTGGSRGKPVKSENAAISFATGNVSGPALASASAALAALKQIRAMWQSMLDASAKDLGALAGSGGGGGGGGGGGEDAEKAIPSAATTEIQRWYTWLRKIYRLEQDISLEEAKQNEMLNDRIANGQKIMASYKQNLKNLRDEIILQQKTLDLQQKWVNMQGAQVNDENNLLYKIFEYDANNRLLTYRGTDKPESGIGLDILEQLNRRDANGKPKAGSHGANADAQLAYIQSLGFNIDDLLINDDGSILATKNKKGQFLDPKTGKKIKKQELNDLKVSMVENFFNMVQSKMDEIDSHQEAIDEANQKIVELESQMNEILDKIRDNQIELENKVLDAVVEREQRRIDEAQDERDALEKANQKFLDGLNDSLQKERDLYQRNQDSQELNKLQRQLAILQRSGGSASQIRSLQDQINQKQQEAYFTEQENQINAIQEASDLQIERLDAQIDIMTETLEYQKEHGLLWNEVYDIMSGNADQIANFIVTYDDTFQAMGKEEYEKVWTELLQSAQMFDSDRGIENEKATAWKSYLANHPELEKEQNAQARNDIRKVFYENYTSTNNAQPANSAANVKYEEFFPTASSQSIEQQQQQSPEQEQSSVTSHTIFTAPLKTKKAPYYNSNGTKKQGNLNNKAKQIVQVLETQVGKKKKHVKIYYNGQEYIVPLTSFSKKGWTDKVVRSDEMDAYAKQLKLKGAIKYKQGGLVDYTGPAWVDGTPNKPEAFLNAEQTASLKKGLFNSDLVTASIDNLRDGWNEFKEQIINNISNNSNETVIIEKAEVNMNVSQINDDYGAHRAGQEVMAEMLKIANKSGTRAITRR